MQKRNLRVLEYYKILDMLATHVITDMGREACLNLEPSSNPDEIRDMQAQTEEANTILAYNGANPMAYFKDVR